MPKTPPTAKPMSIETLLFYGFATVLVASAMGVVTVRNPVHAALLLVLTFFTSACLWLLLHAEFLAIALILVYVGAVMVLFLFVVMMLDIKVEPLREGFARYLPVGRPEIAARFLDEWGVDEIVLLDMSAGSEGRSIRPETVARVSRVARVPLTAGGGIPPGVARLLAGLVFGEGGVATPVLSADFLELAGEIGVVLLLLTLGLEYTPEELVEGARFTLTNRDVPGDQHQEAAADRVA